jgi:hypothetical protein
MSAHTAKPPGDVENRGFALVPHSRRFLGQQSLGVEPAVKGCGFFTFAPHFRAAKRGGPGRLGKISARATARLRKKKAPTLEGRGRVFHPTGDSGDVQQLRRSQRPSQEEQRRS